jgi:hypothetical protein
MSNKLEQLKTDPNIFTENSTHSRNNFNAGMMINKYTGQRKTYDTG